jgi:hypothetical protein
MPLTQQDAKQANYNSHFLPVNLHKKGFWGA